MSRSIHVEVAGKKIALRTDAETQYLRELAHYVDGHIKDINASQRPASSQAVALLAAMRAADELFRLRREHRRLKKQVLERTQKIIKHLDGELDRVPT